MHVGTLHLIDHDTAAKILLRIRAKPHEECGINSIYYSLVKVLRTRRELSLMKVWAWVTNRVVSARFSLAIILCNHSPGRKWRQSDLILTKFVKGCVHIN